VPKPAVMAVNGIAFTLSIELALAADIVIAADDVRFRQLETGRGIIPFGGAGGRRRWRVRRCAALRRGTANRPGRVPGRIAVRRRSAEVSGMARQWTGIHGCPGFPR